MRPRRRPDRPAPDRGRSPAGRARAHPRPAHGARRPRRGAGPGRLPGLLLDHRRRGTARCPRPSGNGARPSARPDPGQATGPMELQQPQMRLTSDCRGNDRPGDSAANGAFPQERRPDRRRARSGAHRQGVRQTGPPPRSPPATAATSPVPASGKLPLTFPWAGRRRMGAMEITRDEVRRCRGRRATRRGPAPGRVRRGAPAGRHQLAAQVTHRRDISRTRQVPAGDRLLLGRPLRHEPASRVPGSRNSGSRPSTTTPSARSTGSRPVSHPPGRPAQPQGPGRRPA